MTPCEPFRDNLKAFADGELNPLARLRVRRHVSRCASCQEEIKEMDLIRKRLRQPAADAKPFTPELKDRLLAGIPDGTPPLPIASKYRRYQKLTLVGGIAVIGLIGFSVMNSANAGGENNDRPTSEEIISAQMKGASTGGHAKPSDNATEADKAMSASASSSAAVGKQTTLMSPQTQAPTPPTHDMSANARTRALSADSAGTPTYDSVAAADEKSKAESFAATTMKRVSSAAPSAVAPTADRFMHRDATLMMVVEDVEAKTESIESMLKGEGGWVESSNFHSPEGDQKSATMSLKVPVERFDNVLSALGKLGTVQSKSITGEDLTEKITDEKAGSRSIEAEIEELRNRLAQKSQSRLLEKQDREDLRDLKMRISIKQARLDMYRKQARMSNIELTLYEKIKAVPTVIKNDTGFVEELSQSVSSAGGIFKNAVKLPVLILIWIAAFAPLWIPLAIAYRYFSKKQ